MAKIKNPVLSGFHPDPSIIYVDGYYYIANSTFEWFPGVEIHKSKDLANWEFAHRPLSSTTLLDLKGNPKSSGVWAPCLSYCEGMFYLVYSNMKTWADDPFKDSANFLTTCNKIDGDWSEPIYLNSSGFDASMFHDDDGKKYLLNMEWDHRVFGEDSFSGILIQEYDHDKKQLVGNVTKIFKGTDRGLVEGPHIYKKNGYYYLMCAEGGTSWEHAESVARSKNLLGPYEVHPEKYIITSYKKDVYIKKAGHASMCKNDDERWYLAHLCGRYTKDKPKCVLGRETAIQEIEWKDDWPYLKGLTNDPKNEFENYSNNMKKEKQEWHYSFTNDSFLRDFQTLRIPFTEDIFSLKKRIDYLTIVGKESIYSTHKQALLARRQTDFHFDAETVVSFNPTHFQEMAGLIYRYDEYNQYYLAITYDEVVEDVVLISMKVDNKKMTYLTKDVIGTKDEYTIGVSVNEDIGIFYYMEDNIRKYVGHEFDTTILSDEHTNPMGFTGAFVGVTAQDLRYQRKEAYFKSFNYKINKEEK